MAIKINITKEVEMPNLPNYLRVKSEKIGRSNGETIDLGELDEEAFLEFKETFSTALHVHWNKRRKKYEKDR